MKRKIIIGLNFINLKLDNFETVHIKANFIKII